MKNPVSWFEIYVRDMKWARKFYESVLNINGRMTYKEGFLTGIIITLIVTALIPLTQYITTTFISPDFFPNMIEHAAEQGVMSAEAAEDYFNLGSYIIQGLIGAPLMGILTTAVVAFFTKKTKIQPG